METEEVLRFSSSFVISCGTVTLDWKKSRVLVIYLRDKDEYLLPKGRVNIGEDWRQAALRETFEETGVQVELFATTAETKATRAMGDKSAEPPFHYEPFAMTRRNTSDGVEKSIYWFVGSADSTTMPVKIFVQPGEESFETRWLSHEECMTRVTFANERNMVRKAIELVASDM